MSQAHQLYFQGKHKEALALYESAASSKPLQSQAYKNMAIVWRDLGRIDKTIEFLRKAAGLDPEDAAIYEQLAWFYYLQGDTRHCVEYASATLQKTSSVLARFVLAGVWKEQEKIELAEGTLTGIIREHPHFHAAHFLRGQLWQSQRQWSRAKEVYEAALRSDPTSAEARLPLARVLAQLKMEQQERQQYVELNKVDARHPEALKRAREIQEAETRERQAKAQEFKQSAASRFKTASIPLSPQRESAPRLRVGLGVTAAGRPLRSSGLMFMASGPFRIYRKKNAEILFKGSGYEIWRIHVSSLAAGTLFIEPAYSDPGKTVAEAVVIEPEIATHTVLVHNVPFGHGFSWAGGKDREYRDRLEVIPDSAAGLILVNDLIVSEYLYSVLPSEMPVSSPLEAFKAQAVIARTNVIFRQKKQRPHRAQPYDLCDSQHCQVYSGLSTEREGSRQAVNETMNEVLTYKGAPINALFHANCGGHTQTAQEIEGWWGEPYLQGIPDFDGAAPRSPWDLELWMKSVPAAFCAPSPYVHRLAFRWVWVIEGKDLEERVRRNAAIGELKQVLPAGRSVSGNLLGVRFVGTKGHLTVAKEHKIRRIMAVSQIRSTKVILDNQYDRKGRLEKVFLFGGGWGHGVGLCQGGASNLAQLKHWNYREILKHYYPEAKLETLQGP